MAPRRNCEPTPQSRKGGTGNPPPTAAGRFPSLPAESPEGRVVAKGNPAQASAVTSTQRLGQTLTGLDRIRAAARRDKDLRFSSLLHHLTPGLLLQAYRALRRSAYRDRVHFCGICGFETADAILWQRTLLDMPEDEHEYRRSLVPARVAGQARVVNVRRECRLSLAPASRISGFAALIGLLGGENPP